MEKNTCFMDEFKKTMEIEDKANADKLISTKNLSRLPDDILKHIQSYFTYETKCSLLESKYNPIKLFLSLNSSSVFIYIRIIHSKLNTDCLRKEINNMLIGFYGLPFSSLQYMPIQLINTARKNMPASDEKILLKSMLQYVSACDPKMAFELFRSIIVVKKFLNQRLKEKRTARLA
jgi:hypothetical protein